jgi:hypothetical protein
MKKIVYLIGLLTMLSCLAGCPDNYVFSTTSGAPGDEVTITPAEGLSGVFTKCQGRNQILIGDMFTGCAEVWNENQVTFRVPPGYPAGSTVPVYLYYEDFIIFPFQIGEFTITGEDPEHDELSNLIWLIMIAEQIGQDVGLDVDELTEGAQMLWDFLWDGSYDSMSQQLKEELSHEIVESGVIPKLSLMVLSRLGQQYPCDPDCTDTKSTVAMRSKLMALASKEMGKSSIAALSASDEEEYDPFLTLVDGYNILGATCTFLGAVAADHPALAVGFGLCSVGAAARAVYLDATTDNDPPLITYPTYDPNLWEGSTIEFMITVDDFTTDVISGVSHITAVSVEPDTSVIINTSTETSTAGFLGPPTVEYTFSISLDDDTSLPDGRVYSVELTAFDKQSNFRVEYLNFIIRKEDDPIAPNIHSMSISPSQMRVDEWDVTLQANFSVTDADGNLDIITQTVTGPTVATRTWYLSPQDAGLNPTSEVRQNGSISTPYFMTELSLIDIYDPAPFNIKVSVYDEDLEYDYMGRTMTTYPTLSGTWSKNVEWWDYPLYDGWMTDVLNFDGSGYTPDWFDCYVYWEVADAFEYQALWYGYCNNSNVYGEQLYIGTIYNNTHIHGYMYNEYGYAEGEFDMWLDSRSSSASKALMSAESMSAKPAEEIMVPPTDVTNSMFKALFNQMHDFTTKGCPAN